MDFSFRTSAKNMSIPGSASCSAKSGCVPAGCDTLYVSHSAQGHRALAVLWRLDRIESPQLPFWLRDGTEFLFDELEHFPLIEIAGNYQDGIVGLIPLSVEGLQTIDGTFSISERAPMVDFP